MLYLGKFIYSFRSILITLSLVTLSTTVFGINLAGLDLSLKDTDKAQDLVPALRILVMLTVLSVAPAILLMMTSFTRILIVLSFVRQALGTQTMPPNQVLVGLAVFLTFFTMSPVIDVLDKKVFTPFVEEKITQTEAIEGFLTPMRAFMLKETRKEDLSLFYSVSKKERPVDENEVEFSTLMPAFMISELKTAFQMGFLIYIPFLVIDMVVSSILMAIGMMMLPPTVVSLPFKLVLFVLVDGWSMIVSSIVRSFRI